MDHTGSLELYRCSSGSPQAKVEAWRSVQYHLHFTLVVAVWSGVRVIGLPLRERQPFHRRVVVHL